MDISISGRGIYIASGQTVRGRKWLRQMAGADRHGVVYVDSGYIQDIAAGAIRDGLVVAKDGRELAISEVED
jgi:hypothetical protein